MAKLYQGILGGFSGKVGVVVGYYRKNQCFIRAKARYVHNPRTEAQQAHRRQFGDMVSLASKLLPALKLGMRQYALRERMTEGNAFVRLNWQHTGGVLDFSRLQLSCGPVAPVAFGGYTVDDLGVLHVDFEKNPAGRRANGSDRVVLCLYNSALGVAKVVDSSMRGRKHASALIPDGWRPEEMHVYGFTMDSEGRCSPSSYIVPRQENPVWQDRQTPPAVLEAMTDAEVEIDVGCKGRIAEVGRYGPENRVVGIADGKAVDEL